MSLLMAYAVVGLAEAMVPAGPSRTQGLSPRLHISQLHHHAYTSVDGAPMRVTDMAQDTEGYLWFTSKNGIYRFDGEHFDHSLSKRLPSQLVKGILAEPDGGLWVGYYFGGVSHIVDGQITTYHDGLPQGTAFALKRTPDGTLWMASTGGLARFVKGAWHQVGNEMGYDGSQPEDMSMSRDGRLWVTMSSQAYLVLSPGGARFQPVDRDTFVTELHGLPTSVSQDVLNRVSTPFVDSSGALWTPGQDGIERFRWSSPGKPPVIEKYGTADGLSDPAAYSYFEDREGSIWVGTALGVDQFRQSRITPHAVDKKLFMPTMAFDADGIGWVGTNFGGFRLSPASTPLPEVGKNVTCVARDRLGNVWMAGQEGIFHIVHSVVTKMPTLTGIPSIGSRYQSMALDGEGNLWVAVSGVGLFRFTHGAWTRIDTLAGMATAHLSRVVGDHGGRLWVAFGDGRLLRMDHGEMKIFDTTSGLDLGAVTDLSLDRPVPLAAGEHGLAMAVGDRFHPVFGIGHHAFDGISGIAQLKSGDVWLQADEGVVHVPAKEMARLVADPSHEVGYERFDAEDGLIGTADKVRPLPSLAEGVDDRVWVTTVRELASLDTRHLVRNRVGVRPSVVTIQADNELYLAEGQVVLPPHTRNLRIDFTAPAVTIPAHTDFRFRLSGVNDQWQEVGTRREAFYTNLAPGNYSFMVESTNEDGVVAAAASPFTFRILPAFYQTWWFQTLTGLAAIGFGAIGYRWRMARLAEGLRIRTQERERIARELHDTLLQSVQGLLLSVEAVTRGGLLGEHVRPDLERAIGLAREALIESRDRVNAIRRNDEGQQCPLEAMLEGVQMEGVGGQPAVESTIEGRIRPLDPVRGYEVTAILREALNNATTHAQAGTVRLLVRFGWRRLLMEVADDGVGIHPDVMLSGQREGHWGMPGMRERARQLGGRLLIRSVVGEGTLIRVVLPARRIYRRRAPKADR
ncbi:MAG TPA: triple tyrosine motif-containing protein [Luteibacter sp.]|nr:triple tyrosine motif-containing protein [Luteibacter sp.]